MGKKMVYYNRKDKKMLTTLCVRVPIEVHLRLEQLAKDQNITLSCLLRSLYAWYDKNHKDVMLDDNE